MYCPFTSYILTTAIPESYTLSLHDALPISGVIFLFLEAPFLFGVQLLLYAGGVVVLVVFAIMLTERLVGQRITQARSEEHTSELQSLAYLVCRLLLEKKKKKKKSHHI